MQFLFPGVLWGLLALAIPIIIHLFHFRRYKRVYFTNVKFLQEVKDERSARRKLRNLLVLLARLLAVGLLVLGFAQPFFGDKDKSTSQRLVSVFVDNSFSMTTLSSDVPLIDKAKRRAEEIVSSYQETDRYQILTHDYSGLSSKILSQEDALSAIDDIVVTPKVKSLNNILQKQKQTFKDQEGSKSYFMLSDFQETISDLTPEIDTTYSLSLVPLSSVTQQNIAIDSAYFTTPAALIGQPNALIVKLTNYSQEKQDDIILSVFQNGQKKPAGSISIDAESSVTDTVNITFVDEGKQEITLQIDDYPIQFDDTYFITTEISDAVKVLSINDSGSNKFIKALFGGISSIELDQVNSNALDYSTFSQYRLIVLEDLKTISTGLISQIEQYINAGGNVVTFPASDANLNAYNKLFDELKAPRMMQWEKVDRTVFDINTDEYVFNKVYLKKKDNTDLPTVSGQFKFMNDASKQGETLLSYRSGGAFVSKYLRGDGHLYVCHAPLDRRHSELVEYAEVFVPMIYKMTFSRGVDQPLAYTLGSANQINVPNGGSAETAVFNIANESAEYIPQQANLGSVTELTVRDEISDAGIYNVSNGKQFVRSIAFNYDRVESNPTVFSFSDLSKTYGDAFNIYDGEKATEFLSQLKEQEEGVFLWRWCLIFALIFLAIETLILRFWK